MVSDEEKEAKLELNRYIYGKNLSKDEIVDYLSIIFGLIERQSKEIEELNEKNGYHLGFIDGRIAKRYDMEAKIEPRLKELDEQMKKEWKEYGNSREYQDMEDEWNFLQSLLEKE